MELPLTSRPALPSDDQKRAEHQALRSRMLSGRWADDLEKALAKHIPPDRRSAWGITELSRNPFRSLASQVGGALYESPPTVRGTSAEGQQLVGLVEQAGYWQLMQRVSTDLVGVREQLVRIDWAERSGILHRPVEPELCVVSALPEAPDVPVVFEELQVRAHPETGKPAWCWEVLDVRDLERPTHRIWSADRKHDWTASFLGAVAGRYQYRDSDGKPFLPVVMYHAERTGRLWDTWFGMEAVFGSLTVGVLLTFWVHGVKDGSFATVLLVGGKIAGLEVRSPNGDRTQVISAEPGSLIEIAPSEDYQGQVQAVQLQPGFDPEKLMAAIGMFEAGFAEYAGVSPADIQRTGADPRSGASLSISREGLRRAQARYAPQLRRGDLDVLAKSAAVLNRATGTRYPELPAAYSIQYPSLPLSADEVRSEREDILAKISAGLLSKIDGYIRLHPGISREQALIELQRIQRENAMFPGPAPAAPFIP